MHVFCVAIDTWEKRDRKFDGFDAFAYPWLRAYASNSSASTLQQQAARSSCCMQEVSGWFKKDHELVLYIQMDPSYLQKI